MPKFQKSFAKKLTGIKPFGAGVLAGGIVLICTIFSAMTLFIGSAGALKDSLRDDLMRVAAQVGVVVDGDLHRTFKKPEQEESAAYRKAIKPLAKMLKATDDLAFVYTCILVEGQVYFVLDPTDQGDVDRDGVDDKSHVMQPYEDAAPAMLRSLREQKPNADEEPVTDKWGTFFSGYSPFYDSGGKFVGIVGVDLAADDYIARLAELRSAQRVAFLIALALSVLSGVGAFHFRRTGMAMHLRHELDSSKTEVIERLVLASEFRDTDTGQHVVRMACYCEALARKIGLSELECTMLRTAAPMHDLGKIGIPDSILLKRGKLTIEEFEVMKTHTTIGAALLSGSEYELLQLAEVIALTHHERWDGHGYPKGLSGEEIPMVGRISAVCDIFDALTSTRPYKEAWSFERAADEIRNLAFNTLDPQLVKAFLGILPEIQAIKCSCADEDVVEVQIAA